MDAEETLAHLLLPGAVSLGFGGARLHRLDVSRDDGGWSVFAVLDGEDGRLRCDFVDVQWVQLAGTWGSGLIVKEFFHRPVPDVLRESLSSITHPDMYTLTVRGGSALTLVSSGTVFTPA